jgi:YVTN family beta-propeller protein
MVVSRRTLLASAFAAAGCGRKPASRYFGWLFIASAGEKALAVADLSDFRRLSSIPLPQSPNQVFRVGSKVFASCPDGRVIYEIDPQSFHISGKIAFPGRIAGCAVCPNGTRIAVAVEQPAAVYLVDPSTRRVTARIPLPAIPALIDVTNTLAAVSSVNGTQIFRISLSSGGKMAGATELGWKPGVVRLHGDANLIIAGASDRAEIATVNSETGALLARLPLAFTPARFCFNSDLGQMFVTGSSADEIAIVSPWQSEVEQTIVAGHMPYAMAVGATGDRNLLYITNAGSGDLSIFDIDTRTLAASVHIGGKPGEVLLTPDGEYALVVNQESGDVSVVRVETVVGAGGAGMLDRTNKVKPLFTVFPTAANPQSAAIVPHAA